MPHTSFSFAKLFEIGKFFGVRESFFKLLSYYVSILINHIGSEIVHRYEVI